MDRRQFLQGLALAGAITESRAAEPPEPQAAPQPEGQTPICEFSYDNATWKVYETHAVRGSAITFVSSRGNRRVLNKSAEAAFSEADPPYLGLSLNEIGTSGHDLLAEKLLEHGDPDPERVRLAAPPLGSRNFAAARPAWNAIVGTKECSDTMPVFPGGNTRTYHPVQYFPELRGPQMLEKRYEGMLGGWMPAIRKVFPVSDTAYIEAIILGDVEAHDRFIVQTWHRTARIENGKVVKVVYGHSYPAYPPARLDPEPPEFYRALLVFADYWDRQLVDFSAAALPDAQWVDFSKHGFAKELMVRPGGVYPKYGAVDRDYYGSEYDGFQDIFTMAVTANLEWGRFDEAHRIIDNYFTDFVDSRGMVNMRGPETAQFGMTLALLARYFYYTRDAALLARHHAKIEATAGMLIAMHEQSLRLPVDHPGYGLIAGWSESDSCLAAEPATWWQPYYANSAFAARGLADLGQAWPLVNRVAAIPASAMRSDEWSHHANLLRNAVVVSVDRNTKREMNPPYVPLLPGAKLTFRESMATERPSPQQWPHRPYTELLHADILPARLAALTIDTMRAYGATTMGVVANVGRPRPNGRDILGFISYGYAQALLRLDRIEEFLLFLYAHRYHDHTPGTWTAGEVSGITGGTAIFCIPAQQTVPILVRWMLALEDSDEDRLYLGRGLPRQWVASGYPIGILQAPTRWGRVDFHMACQPANKRVAANVTLAHAGAPKELYVKMRLPAQNRLQSATVNGRPATIGGTHNDTVIVSTSAASQFEIVGRFA